MRTLALTLAVLMVSGVAGEAHGQRRKRRPPPPPVEVPPAPDLPRPGKTLNDLTVGCNTPGADVFVDQELIGKTPIDLPVPVTSGSHTIRVTKVGFAPYNDVFRAVPGKAVKLDVELIPVAGVLVVNSSLKDVRVSIDGKYVGDAPVAVELETGPRSIQISKQCHTEISKKVVAVAGQEVKIDAELAVLPDAINPCILKPPPPLRWYQKKWVWGVVGAGAVVVAGAVVGGAVGSTLDPLRGADDVYTISLTGRP